ncbi:hypothetical protein P8C59_000855 [Phyllachora maydis]|uniref:Copper acquisition factor BIM1-like domain-containing protein n=1 Tax=Phyllachora maydis TaxID=1825666 RepID=A0AAD9HX88_9PEZI|nr:hypothetical protein P8C59_000855 [Phyllachora maydis]
MRADGRPILGTAWLDSCIKDTSHLRSYCVASPLPTIAMLSIRALSVLAALASTTSAHFTLNSLISAGFDDDAEATAQCGGFTVEFSNKSSISNFHTGGEVIATSLYHSQSDFLYRGTLDTTAAGGWIQLFPIVSQQGLGDMCEPAIPAPEAWVGKQGILGVAVNGPDGVLFQCAAVTFVSGMATMDPSTCKNASGVTVTMAMSDSKLSALVGNGPTSNGGSPTSSGNMDDSKSTSSSATSTPTSHSAAPAQAAGRAWALAAGLITMAAVALVAAIASGTPLSSERAWVHGLPM